MAAESSGQSFLGGPIVVCSKQWASRAGAHRCLQPCRAIDVAADLLAWPWLRAGCDLQCGHDGALLCSMAAVSRSSRPCKGLLSLAASSGHPGQARTAACSLLELYTWLLIGWLCPGCQPTSSHMYSSARPQAAVRACPGCRAGRVLGVTGGVSTMALFCAPSTLQLGLS